MKKLQPLWPHALLIGFSGILIIGMLNTGHDWGGDFSSYIMQAKALVEGEPGKFVDENRFTIVHTTRAIAPVAYPWGYPAMLAPIYAGFGENYIALKSVAVACYLLLLIVIAVGFRKNHSGVWLLGLVGLFAVSPTLLAFLNRINSDIPFMFISTLGVFMIGRFVVQRRYFVSPVWDGIGLGLLIATASSIRSNGILLLVTLLLSQVVAWRMNRTSDGQPESRKPGSLLHALPYLAFFVVMLLLRATLPGGEESHLDYLKQITPGGIKYHLTYYGFLPTDFYEGIPYAFPVYLLTLPLAFLGIARRLREDFYIVIYLVLTYILYVLWPITQPIRFLFPILPFYLSFVLTGLEVLRGNTDYTRNRLRPAVCFLPVLFVFICFSWQSIGLAQNNLNRGRATVIGPHTQPSEEMFDFIRTYTEADSAVIFYKPRVMWMFTGRKAYSTRDLDNLSAADYMVLLAEKQKRQYQPDQVAQLIDQGLIEQVYENSGFRVYRLVKREDVSAPKE